MDSFITNDVFTRLAWAQYSSLQPPKEMVRFQDDINSLITTTKLNTCTLVHALYYLNQLVKKDSLSNKKNIDDLYELLIVLMMVANKAIDDSSYTLKTWDNLTIMTTAMLKKEELSVLKKIDYDLFLKEQSYSQFCNTLQTRAYSNGILNVFFSPPVSQQLQPVLLQPILTLPSLTSTNASPFFDAKFPLTPTSPVVDLLPSLKKRSLESDFILPPKRSRLEVMPMPMPMPMMPIAMLQQPQQPQQQPKSFKSIDHQNCTCCCLTNMTNVYYNSLKGKL